MVTELATTENSYQEAFQTLQAGHRDAAASWVVRLRENAMSRFTELGFPSVKEEEWKYTNVAPIARTNFTPIETETAGGADAQQLAALGVEEAVDSQLVFV